MDTDQNYINTLIKVICSAMLFVAILMTPFMVIEAYQNAQEEALLYNEIITVQEAVEKVLETSKGTK